MDLERLQTAPYLLLDISYNDQYINKAASIMTYQKYDTTLRSSFSDRVRADLLALDLPEFKYFQSATIVDAQNVVVQAFVCVDMDILTKLDNCHTRLQQHNITKIVITNIQARSASPPLTTLRDYYQLSLGKPCTKIKHGIGTPPASPVRPLPTLDKPAGPVLACEGPSTVPVSNPNGCVDPAQLDIRTNPISEDLCPFLDKVAEADPALESVLRLDFERLLQTRMTELQAEHEREKNELLEEAAKCRSEFEELLAQRMKELQEDFNKREKYLQGLIADRPASACTPPPNSTFAPEPDEAFTALLETTLRARRAEDKLAESEARVQAARTGKTDRAALMQVREWEPQGAGEIEEVANERELQYESSTPTNAPGVHCRRTRNIEHLRMRAAELRAELMKRRLFEAESSVVELVGVLQMLRREHKEQEGKLREAVREEMEVEIEMRQCIQVEKRAELAREPEEREAREYETVFPELTAILLKFDGIVDDIVREV